MATQRPMPRLDAAKLRENALTSIRLGVEDFERCRHPAGDPARALSAIRNLFAGVLLLFKYKIATCVDDPANAAALIFNPPEVLPHSDGEGGIAWVPVGKFRPTTIDVGTIQKRFEAFEIDVDWDVIEKLQACRNHLEHLHPAHTLGEVAEFVAELFPVLRDFIQTELEESPAAILGDAWQLMLLHHNFFVDTTKRCEEAWSEAYVPEGMEPWLKESKCPECGSTLLAPAQESLDAGDTVKRNDDRFKAICIACGYTDLVAPLMVVALENAHSYDPRDGGEASLEGCNQCGRGAFLIYEQSCLWCAAELEYTECEMCEERLGQEDQHNGGLCSYHAHSYEKFMRED
ncbi:hypothetical protein GYM54_20515 [Pseudomonas sp. MTM4]|uniref:hypothetical protein n=1 Tax=unclassified Pseudomonas TaxID=196821 RepID=UPI0018D20C11|nr:MULTISPECIES: hypothetical protein [unclassified Pseudomonas]MBC8647912.1 hypothetical protein [Pseudomonas sp. MT4]QXY93822.1 hypothetical protein GYM54_20515 [Pseudomonas sp. MTM4]